MALKNQCILSGTCLVSGPGIVVLFLNLQIKSRFVTMKSCFWNESCN